MQGAGSMICSSYPFSLTPITFSITKTYLSLLCQHYRNEVAIQNHIHGCTSCTVKYMTDVLCYEAVAAGKGKTTLIPHTSYQYLTTQNRENKRSFTLVANNLYGFRFYWKVSRCLWSFSRPLFTAQCIMCPVHIMCTDGLKPRQDHMFQIALEKSTLF